MNKAFEKIIERLEELRQEQIEELCKHKDFTSEMQSMRGHNILQDAKKIVQEVAEEYNGDWISVKDRLPDKAGSYLVIGKSGGATVTRWYMPSEFYPEGHFGGNSSDYIRYWMPRPEPPKERD